MRRHGPPEDGELLLHCNEVREIYVEPTSLEFQDRNMNRSTNYGWIHHRGKVLIINNSFRHGREEYRIGSQIDVKNMQDLWAAFGCDVIVREDLTVDEMHRTIDNFATRCQGCDYCIVYIMSHGACSRNMDFVLGNEGGELSFNEIKRLFHNDHSHCLRGIPKLLFFQCCRTDPAMPDGSQSSSRRLSHSVEADCGPIVEPILTCSDMLIACATQQGSLAWRNSHNGSWFINAIANVFMQYAHEEHIADMMTKVNNAVASKALSMDSHSVQVSMPVYEVTLRKKLYLYPGRTGAHEGPD